MSHAHDARGPIFPVAVHVHQFTQRQSRRGLFHKKESKKAGRVEQVRVDKQVLFDARIKGGEEQRHDTERTGRARHTRCKGDGLK